MIKLPLAYLLTLGLLISMVQTETVFEGTVAAWCPANGQSTFDASEQTTADTVDFDLTSTYYTDQKESAPLFVKIGSGTTPYSFKIYSNAGHVEGATSCTGTAAYAFHALINEYLFLTNNGGKYYVCKYNKGADSSAVELSTTGLFTDEPLTDWDPYMVSGDTLYILASTTSKSKVVTYTWVASGPITADTITRPSTPQALASNAGSQQFLYDKNRTKFIKVNTAGDTWVDDTVLTSTVIGTNNVAVYPLRETKVVITLTSTDAKSGAVYTAQQKTATEQLAYVTGSVINIQDFTDNQHNFVRIDSSKFFWLTMGTTESSFAFIKSTIAIPDELNLVSRGMTVANIFNVGLSQNKASILYDTGKLDILRHEGNGAVKLLFTKQITGTPVISATQSKQYKITIGCTCESIKKFVCFSQTLNCVIVNKAGATCAGSGDIYNTW